jgi:L,D-peptidoglycan transpeptidase YkuD (ErfK/YbiS/YcfS/YnhG family)
MYKFLSLRAKRSNLLLGVIFLSGCASMPVSLTQLEHDQRQAVLVEPAGKHYAHVSLWEKDSNADWHKLASAPAVIGRNGLAGIRAKKEGDGRTPSGIFDLKRSFGYEPVLDTGLQYTQVTANDLWVDDAASPLYNQWTKAPTEAKSFEQLKRGDDLYKIAAIIEYNTDPIVPGDGSAIFMHIWRRYDHPTAGCVALSERNIRRLMRHLDKTKKPVIILVKRGHPAA